MWNAPISAWRPGFSFSRVPKEFSFSRVPKGRAPASASLARIAAAIVAVAIGAAANGCGSPAGPVFPEITPPIEWPMPPDAPRVRYVGQLLGEKSLNRGKTGWEAFRTLVAGAQAEIEFSTPTAVAVQNDRVYVADGQARSVYIMNLTDRSFLRIDRAAGKALGLPLDVAVAGGAVAVADSKRGAVFVFSPTGAYRRTIGAGTLNRPAAVAWDAGRSLWWVLDAALHQCLAFDANGTEARRVGGRGASGGQFNYPAGMTYAAGVGLVVADSMNFRVQILDGDGRPTATFGQKGDGAGDFSLPRDVAVDSEGHVYVVDSQFENVQIFDASGRLLMAVGREGRGPGEFYLPSGIFIDDRDRIWIADTYNRRVQVFQYLSNAERETRSADVET